MLLALRIEASRNEDSTMNNDLGIRSSMIPQWLCEPNFELGPENSQDSTSLPAGDAILVIGYTAGVREKSGTESRNWDSEFSTSGSGRREEVASNSLLSSDIGATTSATLKSPSNTQ